MLPCATAGVAGAPMTLPPPAMNANTEKENPAPGGVFQNGCSGERQPSGRNILVKGVVELVAGAPKSPQYVYVFEPAKKVQRAASAFEAEAPAISIGWIERSVPIHRGEGWS